MSADVCDWILPAGICLDCGQRMYEVGGLPARCDCWDEPRFDADELVGAER